MDRPDSKSPQYKRWRKAVYKRDRRACIICGSKRKLNAHHLDAWSWAISKRYDVDNGVTLCRIHHNMFHDLYGRQNNTRFQFEAFLLTCGLSLEEIL